jgi:hypothetical protein
MREALTANSSVLAALDAAIQETAVSEALMDGRVKPGHDGARRPCGDSRLRCGHG